MKNEAPPHHHQLNEQSIKDAAAAALHDLQLDVEATAVSADGDNWCVQFSAEYNQFCDSFRDQFGTENSFELIREKVKRYILKQQQTKIRAGVRIRRGKRERPSPQPASLFETTLKTIAGVAGQTSELTSEVIQQASRLPETALKTLDEATKAASSTATLVSQAVERVTEQPLARVTVKAAAKPKSKRSKQARQAASKKAPSSKKAASKKQRATAKSTSRPVKKRGGTKKRAKGK